MKKVIEVEGGFIAKEYDERGSVISKSEVFATKEEAEAGEVAQEELVEGSTPSEGETTEETPSDETSEEVQGEASTASQE